jgi:hypothetical protein
MRWGLLACSAATWVYGLEGLKRWPAFRWLHFRSRSHLWILNVLGALLNAWIWHPAPWLVTAWGAVVFQQLLYDAIVHRRTGAAGGLRG